MHKNNSCCWGAQVKNTRRGTCWTPRGTLWSLKTNHVGECQHLHT